MNIRLLMPMVSVVWALAATEGCKRDPKAADCDRLGHVLKSGGEKLANAVKGDADPAVASLARQYGDEVKAVAVGDAALVTARDEFASALHDLGDAVAKWQQSAAANDAAAVTTAKQAVAAAQARQEAAGNAMIAVCKGTK